MSLSKQKGLTSFLLLLGTGILFTTTAVLLFLAQKNQIDVTPISNVSFSPSPTPVLLSPSPSSTATPSASIQPKKTHIALKEIAPKQSEVFIEKIVYEKENGRPKITLDGRKFGEKKNQILLDNSVYNYGYTIISWNDNHIEFYGSEWVPKDKNVTVALLSTNGEKSNAVSFFNPK